MIASTLPSRMQRDALAAGMVAGDDRPALAGQAFGVDRLRDQRDAEVADGPDACEVGMLLHRLARDVDRILNDVAEVEIVFDGDLDIRRLARPP